MSLKTIAVDAMGGDFGLDVSIPGAISFLNRHDDVHLIMVGDEARILAALKAAQAPLSRISIQAASQIVDMDESPTSAMKNKKDSSMRVAINQIKEGKAQATVSAGNTGALMATARFVLKTIPGVDRPAIAKFLPGKNNHLTLVLDLGANVDCSSEQLLQFAIMGSELVGAIFPEKTAPRVGLLNVGTEDIKGNHAAKETHQLLTNSQLNFVGNVEGNGIFSAETDVLVVDGFTGNAMLKSIEGSVKFFSEVIKEEYKSTIFNKMAALFSLPTFKGVKKRLDPRRFNGAILIGLRGVVIKSHGGTDAVGFAFALQEAYQSIKADSIARIQAGVTHQLDIIDHPSE